MNGTRRGWGAARQAAPALSLVRPLIRPALIAAALLTVGAALVAALTFQPASASAATQVSTARGGLTVDVWINKEEGGVFTSGEKMQVFFRANQDAYVLIYNIDTEGYIHLIYPFRPNDPMRVQGGETYRVPSRHDPYDLVAEGPEGMEYVVAVASPLPFSDLPWFLAPGATSDGRGQYDDQGDDQDELEQGVIVGDPYVGMARLMERIVPEGREDRVATANTYFYLERRVDYPRYVCADCHHRNYWFNPYVDYCSVVEIRVDATWYRYAPIRTRTSRPRYYYKVRTTAPTRYRQWKEQWSSLDGNRALRQRFVLERETQHQRQRDDARRQTTPPDKSLRRYRSNRQDRPDRMWHGRDQVIPLRERNDEQRQRQDQRQDQGRPSQEERRRGDRVPDQRQDRGRQIQDERRQADEQRRQQGREERRRDEQQPRDDRPQQPREDRRQDQQRKQEQQQPKEERPKDERQPPREERRRDDQPQRDDRQRSNDQPRWGGDQRRGR